MIFRLRAVKLMAMIIVFSAGWGPVQVSSKEVKSLATSNDLAISNPRLYATLKDQVFMPLFKALSMGDLPMIKRYLHEDLYEQYQTLFEHNPHYGQYLKDYYQGATFELVTINRLDDRYVAQVEIHWLDGQSTPIEFQVTAAQPASTASSRTATKASEMWKIRDSQ